MNIAKAAVLVIAAIAAWCATAVLGIMCVFSVVLGPLVIGVFVVAAAVAGVAVTVSAAAVGAVLDLFPSQSMETAK